MPVANEDYPEDSKSEIIHAIDECKVISKMGTNTVYGAMSGNWEYESIMQMVHIADTCGFD